jgi:transposase
VAERRTHWQLRQAGIDAKRLVFLDETGAKTNLTRTHGRSLEGQRLVEKVPHGHWMNTTFVAGLRLDGWVAPLTIDGALNGELFRRYVEQQLAPELRPGDLVVMDNLASHKVAGVREALQAVGSDVLYLPPYSPDLNPIEQAFSKLKTLIRKAKQRTIEGLWETCGRLLDCFTTSDFENYIRHCGYRYT